MDETELVNGRRLSWSMFGVAFGVGDHWPAKDWPQVVLRCGGMRPSPAARGQPV